jgi:antitoxin component YwqK of YwqJK toxin-antitoxin module
MNGIGLYWYASGDLYQGTYKDNKRDGFHIIYYKDGDRAYAEYQDGFAEGLCSIYKSNDTIWRTYSKG